MKDYSQAGQPRLGIMGGGQLGLFLCEAARGLGVHSTVIEPNAQGSALHVADRAIVAPLDDLEAVQKLISASDVITFELEAIPDESLEQLRLAEAAGSVLVHPGVDTLALFKDKGIQKEWLNRERLPTLPHVTVSEGQIPAVLQSGDWSFPVVQKAHRGGYDGKGVQLLRSAAALEQLWPVPSYLEPALSPLREIGVVVARDIAGNLSAFPPVSMTFDDRYNAVFSVSSPGQFSPDLGREAEALALQAIGRLDSPGVYAVELFVALDEQGADYLTINEISPRVHNSGHLTMEAFEHSQFEQHVRAIMGMPLGDISIRAPAAVMLNLLYEDALKAACPAHPEKLLMTLDESLPAGSSATVHWYGKSTGQRGRKMGHLTATARAVDDAWLSAEATLQALRHWPAETVSAKEQTPS